MAPVERNNGHTDSRAAGQATRPADSRAAGPGPRSADSRVVEHDSAGVYFMSIEDFERRRPSAPRPSIERGGEPDDPGESS